MTWQTRTRIFDLSRTGLVMGILNVTPDSFSDGGLDDSVEQAVARGLAMVAEGARVIDVGGESTRPGAESVSEAEELRRVLPVIEGLARAGVAISIDTRKPAVAAAALAAGAEIVNDVSGLEEAAMRAVVQATGAGVVVMHMQGNPREMQKAPQYNDVVAEVRQFFRQREALCLRSGVPSSHLSFDPGIGFGKTAEHNWELLRALRGLAPDGRPLVLGVSRKAFLGKAVGSSAMADRSWPTVALTSHSRSQGARVVRVHEVRANAEAMRMTEALLEEGA